MNESELTDPAPARSISPGDDATVEQLQQALKVAKERERSTAIDNQNRVRNLMALTRSIFSRTLANSSDFEDLGAHFLGRLSVLARYHGHFAGVSPLSFDLESIIGDELLTVAAADDPRVHVSGPELRLSVRTAEMMALALHELVANSVKFGALAGPDNDARLEISWTSTGDGFTLDWLETNIAIVAPAPIQTGFGREFIEQALPYQLGGTTEFSIAPGQVSCRISAPN